MATHDQEGRQLLILSKAYAQANLAQNELVGQLWWIRVVNVQDEPNSWSICRFWSNESPYEVNQRLTVHQIGARRVRMHISEHVRNLREDDQLADGLELNDVNLENITRQILYSRTHLCNIFYLFNKHLNINK